MRVCYKIYVHSFHHRYPQQHQWNFDFTKKMFFYTFFTNTETPSCPRCYYELYIASFTNTFVLNIYVWIKKNQSNINCLIKLNLVISMGLIFLMSWWTSLHVYIVVLSCRSKLVSYYLLKGVFYYWIKVGCFRDGRSKG